VRSKPPPWPPSTPAVPCLPRPRRHALELRLDSLFLCVEGIEPGSTESTPASPFSCRASELAATNSATAGLSLATPTLLEYSRWDSGPASPLPSLPHGHSRRRRAGRLSARHGHGQLATGQRGCHVGLGPQRSETVGHSDPMQKDSPCLFLEKLQKSAKSCKMHILFPVYQKKVYDLSKCSEKWTLPVCVNIMHC
jgi:hypothetical protein